MATPAQIWLGVARLAVGSERVALEMESHKNGVSQKLQLATFLGAEVGTDNILFLADHNLVLFASIFST